MAMMKGDGHDSIDGYDESDCHGENDGHGNIDGYDESDCHDENGHGKHDSHVEIDAERSVVLFSDNGVYLGYIDYFLQSS